MRPSSCQRIHALHNQNEPGAPHKDSVEKNVSNFFRALSVSVRENWETDSTREPKTGFPPFDAWGVSLTPSYARVFVRMRPIVPLSDRRAAGRLRSTRTFFVAIYVCDAL